MNDFIKKYDITEEKLDVIKLYLDLLEGKNINNYKKVTKNLSFSLNIPVQDFIRIVFKCAKIEKNILVKSNFSIEHHE